MLLCEKEEEVEEGEKRKSLACPAVPNLVDKFAAGGESCTPGGSGAARHRLQHKHADKKASLFVQGIAIDFV